MFNTKALQEIQSFRHAVFMKKTYIYLGYQGGYLYGVLLEVEVSRIGRNTLWNFI